MLLPLLPADAASSDFCLVIVGVAVLACFSLSIKLELKRENDIVSHFVFVVVVDNAISMN